jgi:H+/Cl- antiporter ClcA
MKERQPRPGGSPEGATAGSAKTPTASGEMSVTQREGFWIVIGYACILGLFGGVVGLLFMGLLAVGESWYVYSSPGWMGGQWWWVAVTAAGGLVVGLLRRLTRLPEKTPGLIADLQEARVDPRLVPGIVLVSTASLIGGASLGPEKALGAMGGAAGGWLSSRGRRNDEDRGVATLSGMAGVFGGLFSSTIIVVMMIVEVARPGGAGLTKVLAATIASSSIAFGVYFAVAGSVFLDIYSVPTYQFEDWHLLAGVGIGLLAAIVSTLLALVVAGSIKLFDKVKAPGEVKSTVGGVLFGVIGVALPLTMLTGSDQLEVVLTEGPALGLGLVVLLVLAKMITMGLSLGSGFIGGPIFPALFIGGSAGVALHLAIPDLPLGLTFTCLLAAVVGAFVSAPFSMVLLAGFMTQVGALNTAPVLIAVITSFLVVEVVKYRLIRRRPNAAGG